MHRLLCLIAATLGFAAASLPALAAPDPAASDAARDDGDNCESCEAVLDLALANPRRQDDRARDAWRHPAETVSFFRIRPGMTVIDVMPGSGWYTRVLVPYLGEGGHYIGLNPDVRAVTDEKRRAGLADLGATFPAKAAGWTGVPAARIAAYNSDAVPPALRGRVDRVIIMREVHNLYRWGMLDAELDTIRGLLKPNGLLGIEEHRARPGAPDAYVDGSKGYMREADVVKAIEARGFQLVGKSEINANAKDSANWPDGVWTLPPSLSQGDADRAKYQAIGESDRMTLLFRKRG